MPISKWSLNSSLIFFAIFMVAGCATTTSKEAINNAPGLTLVDQYTLTGDKDLLRDYAATDEAGNINVVVEIPAGSNAKWEVEKKQGQLKWESKKGKPRMVAYLSYPGNYGMIPRTLLPKELGGDGDPLDVIIIGHAVPRGSVVKCRPIGVLKLLDRAEQDDKIIAVLIDSPLSHISSIEVLQREFIGITDILKTWFSNYKGPGKMQFQGFGEEAEARTIIDAAVAAF